MNRAITLITFKKHATSKLTKLQILTLFDNGLRGEALASITAVAKTEILTRPSKEITGTKIVIHGGKVLDTSDAGTVSRHLSSCKGSLL